MPFAWTGNPAPASALPAVSFASNFSSYTYDALGRPLVATGTDGVVTGSFTYHPLKTDVMDGEQLTSGPHKGLVHGDGAPTVAAAPRA